MIVKYFSVYTNDTIFRQLCTQLFAHIILTLALGISLLPDTWNYVLCMRQECRERFPRHRLQRKPLSSDPGMHHSTCVTHVPWCMSGSLNRDGGDKHSRRMRKPQFYVSGERPTSVPVQNICEVYYTVLCINWIGVLLKSDHTLGYHTICITSC